MTPSEQARLNLEQARDLRAAGLSYREVRGRLNLSSGQLGHIRRALKREKAARTRLRSTMPQANERDLPISRSVLPAGLRRNLVTSGFKTLGDVADRLADPDFRGLESLSGIGPHRALLVRALLEHFGLLAGSDDLQAAIEQLFPDLRETLAHRD